LDVHSVGSQRAIQNADRTSRERLPRDINTKPRPPSSAAGDSRGEWIMRRIKLWAAATVLGLSLAGSAFGQTKGDEVVVVSKEAELKHEATVVKTVYRGAQLTVQQVNGKWLWVELGGTRGWIDKERVVLASRAIVHFTEELKRNNDDAGLYVARARAWQRKGELTNAIRDCTEAIKLSPSWDYPYAIRASAQVKLGEHEKAIADFGEAIHLDPKDPWGHFSRGQCFYEMKQFDKAISDYTEAIRLDPSYEAAYNMRGLAYQDLENYDKAIADHTEAIGLASDEHKYCPLMNRARAWSKKKDYLHAVEDYTELTRLLPDSTVGYYGRGRALINRGDPDQAIQDFTKAIELNPKEAWNYSLRGECWSALGKFETALSDYADALRINPDGFRTQMAIARVRASCPEESFRDGKLAVELATKACELSEWKRADCIATLASAFAEVGDFEAAVSQQLKAMSLASKDELPDLEARLKLYQSGQPYRYDVKVSSATATAAK